MKKWGILVLCVLALCLAAAPALADSWSFLHSAFRLTASADMELLAQQNGLTLAPLKGLGSKNFLVGGITFGGLTPTVVQVFQRSYSPLYDCLLIFDREAGGSEQGDLQQVHTVLLDALTAKYGEPTMQAYWASSPSAEWKFQEVTISLSYAEGGEQPSTVPQLQLLYDTWASMNDPAASQLPTFPYPATDFVAMAEEEANQPYTFRGGVQGGMTMDQVIAAEGRKPDARTEGSLTYWGLTIDGRDATLLYRFEFPMFEEEDAEPEEPWLAYAQVLYTAVEANKDAYMADYTALDQELVKRFGTDFDGDGQWSVPWDYEEYGTGSELRVSTSWYIQDAIIVHLLEVRGSALQHGILYTFYGQTNCSPETDALTWPEDMLAWGD